MSIGYSVLELVLVGHKNSILHKNSSDTEYQRWHTDAVRVMQSISITQQTPDAVTLEMKIQLKLQMEQCYILFLFQKQKGKYKGIFLNIKMFR